MDHPAIDSLMETVRKINQMARRARSDDPGVEDYLRSVSSDPVTEWFTALLREKNKQLDQERERSDRLANALRAWRRAKRENMSKEFYDEADLQLVKTLREMGIVEP